MSDENSSVRVCCIGNNPVAWYCISKECRADSVICQYEHCSCQLLHQGCRAQSKRQTVSRIREEELNSAFQHFMGQKRHSYHYANSIKQYIQELIGQFESNLAQIRHNLNRCSERLHRHFQRWFQNPQEQQLVEKARGKKRLDGGERRIFYKQLLKTQLRPFTFNTSKSLFRELDYFPLKNLIKNIKDISSKFNTHIDELCSLKLKKQPQSSPLSIEVTPVDLIDRRLSSISSRLNILRVQNYDDGIFNFKNSTGLLMQKIKPFRFVRELIFEASQLRPKHIAMIPSMFQQLHTFEIRLYTSHMQMINYTSPANDESIESIIHMKQLRRLTLQKCKLTDIGLKYLSQKKPDLLKLDLSESENFSKQGLLNLQKFEQLQQLNLKYLTKSQKSIITRIVDDFVLQNVLPKLELLRILKIENSKIGNPGIDAITANCPLLECLDISGNDMYDKTLEIKKLLTLARLKNLRNLQLRRMGLNGDLMSLILAEFSHSKLQSIDFSVNLLAEEAAKAVYSELPSSLEEINLSNNLLKKRIVMKGDRPKIIITELQDEKYQIVEPRPKKIKLVRVT